MANFKTLMTYGSVKLKSLDKSSNFYISYWCKAANRMISESTGTSNIAEAKKIAKTRAESIPTNAVAKNNILSHVPVVLQEALIESIKNSKSKDNKHRTNLLNYAEYFRIYMLKNFPLVKFWYQIVSEHLQSYVDYLTSEKRLKSTTVKNYISVVLMTNRYMCQRYAKASIYYPFIAPFFVNDIRQIHYLSFSEISNVLSIAREQNEPYAEIGFLLGCLAGLRIKEIVRLEISNFDFENSTVFITHTKNKFSIRTIPLFPALATRIQEIYQTRNTSSPYLIERCPKQGPLNGVVTYGEDYTISKPMRRVLNHGFEVTGNNNYLNCSPMDSRKSFVNMCVDADVDPVWRDSYIGHAGGTTAERYYTDRNSPRRIDKLRNNVTNIIQTKLLIENVLSSTEQQTPPAKIFDVVI